MSKGKERFTIPKTTGDSVAEAQTALAAIPVKIAPATTEQQSLTVPKGKVINTSPAAGVRVKRDSTVTILVSTGPPIIGIPNIDPGTPFDTAAQTLQTAGFKVQRVDQFSKTIPRDAVISISPTGTAPKLSTITVTVSKGPEIVKVPDIHQGMSVDQAKQLLTEAGLKYDIQEVGGSDTVLAISPKAGTKVPSGSTVIVYTV